MKYDAEKDSYQFSQDEIYTIMWALRFTLWKDGNIHAKDKTHIDNIYLTFNSALRELPDR